MAESGKHMWRLLGPPALPVDDRDIADTLGKKHLAVLIYLLINPEPVRRQELADLLWPGSDRQAARHNLRQAVHAIRRALGDELEELIVGDKDSIGLIRSDLAIDIQRLAGTENGEELSPGELKDLIRGPLADGFDAGSIRFEEWLADQRRAYATRLTDLLDTAIRNAMKGRGSKLLSELETLKAQIARDVPEMAHVQAAPLPTQDADEPSGYTRAPWYRGLPALALGLAIGTAAILGGYAVSRDVRLLMREVILGQKTEVPSIAVRPFAALNGTDVERNLAGGVTIGVTYALYAVTDKELFVVTVPTDTEDLAGFDSQDYASELGVRYLISGTLERDGDSIRVFVRCLDAESGHDIWQDRFTSKVTQAFELQDQITLRILSGLEIDLTTAERNRIQYLDDTENLQAWLLAVDGVRNLIKLDPENMDAAIQSYGKALQIDPNYISARRGVAWHALLQVRFGTAPQPEAAILEARNHLNVILRKRPDDGMSKALEGLMLLLENSWTASIEAGEAASRLLPGSADVWAVLAHSYTFVGELEKAMEAIDRAMALSPGHPPFYRWIKARALRLSGDPEGAIALLELDPPKQKDALVRLVELTAAYVNAGRLNEAREVAQEIKEQEPGMTASAWVLHPAIQDPDIQSLEFEILSKAGL